MNSAAVVCNNFGSTDDGIGNYAAVMKEALEGHTSMLIFSARCPQQTSAIKKLVNFGMTRAILKLACSPYLNRLDAVIIEYPFVEQNPCFLLAVKRLSKKLERLKKPLILSLHEYRRCNPLRQLVIRRLARLSDVMLVTDEGDAQGLADCCGVYYLRSIPSNIAPLHSTKARANFLFFGLVNKAKAFGELLQAWSEAQIEGEVLQIATATEIEDQIVGIEGIRYYHNQPEEVIAGLMSEAKFCILPIKPEVDCRNTTFIGAISSGCICIGKFSDELAKLPFLIDIQDYSVESIVQALRHAAAMPAHVAEEMSQLGCEYSKRFSLDAVAEQYGLTLDKIICGNSKEEVA